MNFLYRPFAATSFAGFWLYWYPFFGYYLYYYLYKPLRGYVARPWAILATFFFSGLLHDLPFQLLRVAAGKPPFFTITAWFMLAGTLATAGQGIGLSFRQLPVAGRCLLQAAALVGCWHLALRLTT